MTTDMADILRLIVARRRERLAGLPASTKQVGGSEARSIRVASSGDRFLKALERCPGRAVIAEVKMGSPRLGSLVGQLNPVRQAELYAESGAAALSVVVEPDFFYGSYELLSRCRQASDLPTLAKDFVVDPRQLDWAAAVGADAVLLIAALLEATELKELADHARSLGLIPFIEIHAVSEIEKLAGGSWELVGVNNRDLRTFEVDLHHSVELIPRLPEGAVKVAESGITGVEELEQLETAGFDAFLVGESLLLADDPGTLLRQMVQ